VRSGGGGGWGEPPRPAAQTAAAKGVAR
jgi:hypothetical protein